MESLDVLFIITTAIRGMNQILVWSVALLAVMLMTQALFLTQVLHASIFSEDSLAKLSEKERVDIHVLFEYFGSFSRCLLSMFELTLGNWPPVTRILQEQLTEWFMPICLLHKLTIGFAVVGVINGVILQETFKVASTDDMIMMRQRKRAALLLKKKMKMLLGALDADGSGTLDWEEFKVIAHIPEVKTWLAAMDIETDDLLTLFQLVDRDHGGSISADELALRMPRIKGAARGIDVMSLMNLMQHTTEQVANLHKATLQTANEMSILLRTRALVTSHANHANLVDDLLKMVHI